MSKSIFILGTERSGTTWLGNIFDSSPDTVFYMEPFAPYARLFPGFPDRWLYLDSSNEMLDGLISEGLGRLEASKYPVRGDAAGAPRVIRSAARGAVRLRSGLARLSGGSAPIGSLRYDLLNMNRLNNTHLWKVSKGQGPLVSVIKELRLNFKARVIASAVPDSQYVVILREPRSQIDSIIKHFEKGALVELRGQMTAFVEAALHCDRFEKFHAALRRIDRGSMGARLAAFWFLSYDTLLVDLAAALQDHVVVTHEDLCRDTEVVTEMLFRRCGLSLSASVKEYIASSTAGNKSVQSPLDTNRSSKSYHLESLRRTSGAVRDSFEEAAEPFWDAAHPHLHRYRSATVALP